MVNYDCDPADFFVINAPIIEAAMKRGIEAALLAHKRAGIAIAVYQDGKNVLVPPEEIDVDDPVARRLAEAVAKKNSGASEPPTG